MRLFTSVAVPGWSGAVLGLVLVLLGQSFAASLVLVFLIMMNRSNLGFLPIRDFSFFVSQEMPLYP